MNKQIKEIVNKLEGMIFEGELMLEFLKDSGEPEVIIEQQMEAINGTKRFLEIIKSK
jgi:hypothetical protein